MLLYVVQLNNNNKRKKKPIAGSGKNNVEIQGTLYGI